MGGQATIGKGWAPLVSCLKKRASFGQHLSDVAGIHLTQEESSMPTIKTTYGPWNPLGARGSVDVQVFAIGDVHGQADVLEAALEAIREMPRTADIRRLIFLGDLIDRGPDSLRAIALARDAAQLAGVEEVVVLPGNHELMLLDGIDEPQMYIGDWLDNGGDLLIEEAQPGCTARKLVDLAAIARGAVGDAFLEQMRTCATWHAEGDLLFVHAGVDPHQDLMTFLDQPRLLALDNNHWAWIREPFLQWDQGWDGRVIVHGHTPAVQSLCGLDEFALGADRVASQRRLCLDAGAAYLPQIGWAEFRENEYRLCMTALSGSAHQHSVGIRDHEPE